MTLPDEDILALANQKKTPTIGVWKITAPDGRVWTAPLKLGPYTEVVGPTVAAERARLAKLVAPEDRVFSDAEWKIRCELAQVILEA